MKQLLERLFVFVVGVPATIAIVILFPQYNHLALNIFVTIVSSLGAMEFATMLKSRGFPIHMGEAAVLGSLSPLAMTIIVSFDTNGQITQFLFIIGASWLLVSEIFRHKSDFSSVINRLTAGFSVMIYPGLFLGWIITMSTLEHSTMVILAFICIVMSNDSLAWVTGVLFGKSNRGIVKVSPNKSITGYAGGMAASILVCSLFVHFSPDAFIPDQIPALPSAMLLGFLSGVTVILGDLAESAIKRSCGFKDSGILIPGRGGAMDCTDSVALTAPLFYVLYRFFF
jgi:phosphatidate cytidylyltransferase